MGESNRRLQVSQVVDHMLTNVDMVGWHLGPEDLGAYFHAIHSAIERSLDSYTVANCLMSPGLQPLSLRTGAPAGKLANKHKGICFLVMGGQSLCLSVGMFWVSASSQVSKHSLSWYSIQD